MTTPAKTIATASQMISLNPTPNIMSAVVFREVSGRDVRQFALGVQDAV